MSLLGRALAAALLLPLAGGMTAAADLPEGTRLVEHGLSADGRTAGAIGQSPDHCWTARLYRERRGDWSLAGERPGARKEPDAPCGPVSAALSGDGGTLAVLQLWDGTVRTYRSDGTDLADAGSFLLPGSSGYDFPAPGSNVALSADGGLLLVGSPNRDCEFSVPRDACGAAHLFRRTDAGWRREASLPRPPGAGIAALFGHAVALSRDGGTAFVGGTGQLGMSGSVWVYRRTAEGWAVESELRSGRGDETWFGSTLDVGAAGSFVAIGGEQAVHLFERRGREWQRVGGIAPPDGRAGTFGAAVAIDAGATFLVTGAPRTACAEGLRCGSAYSYVLLRRDGEVTGQLRERLTAPLPTPLTDFGWRIATDDRGRRVAVQGRLPFVFGP